MSDRTASSDQSGDAGQSSIAVIVLTGDELLRGFIQDANTVWLARRLRTQGWNVVEARVVGDDEDQLVASLEQVMTSHRPGLVITSGGLGPTHDDRTADAVARVIGRPCVVDPDALAVVRRQVEAFGRRRDLADGTYEAGIVRQATVPQGSFLLEPAGTAPGLVVPGRGDELWVVLPGPPAELRASWLQAEEHAEVLSRTSALSAPHERLLRFWGIPESRLANILAEAGHGTDSDECRATLCARDGELELSLRGTDAARVDALARAVADRGDEWLFALDDHRDVANLIGSRCESEGMSIAVAESCTAGMVAAALAAVEGASGWLRGGVITYTDEIKHDVLGVQAATLELHSAVSEQVACEMAARARSLMHASHGVSVTGFAGPGGGSDESPVGTVWIGVADEHGAHARMVRIRGSRQPVRQRATVAALHDLRIALSAGTVS